ncbi:peptidylprolyl cistrans isomerase [Pycnococcus provasolii]|uniref:peptidylprolyl isomerase n=1 Tax=Pycnococcus provasolii TaxID=41880 RepID=A0A830H5J7_9CHLO|nr:peptidylprolyl cistrans isomerase [Pycnococcus provasolii]
MSPAAIPRASPHARAAPLSSRSASRVSRRRVVAYPPVLVGSSLLFLSDCSRARGADLPNAEMEIVASTQPNKGKGASASAGDFVVIAFVAKLDDNRVIQATAKRPVAFVLGGAPFGYVTEGLMQAVVGMQVGAKRTVIVPSVLAFGENGAVIPPSACDGPLCDKSVGEEAPIVVPSNARITYDVELLKLVPARSVPKTMVR